VFCLSISPFIPGKILRKSKVLIDLFCVEVDAVQDGSLGLGLMSHEKIPGKAGLYNSNMARSTD
jgi:hypothetical protein